MTEPIEIEVAGFPALHAQGENGRRQTPIVFQHGLWGTDLQLAPYLRFFSSVGFDCYAACRRGRRGVPPERAHGVRFADYVGDALSVLDAIHPAPIVIGWSLGGLVAQKIAEAGRCCAAVLVAPVAPGGIHFVPRLGSIPTYKRHALDILQGRPFQLSYASASSLLLNGVAPRERRRIFETLVADSGRVAREFALTGVKVDEAKVRCPVLCVVGLDDNATPARSVRSVAEKYDAELREYPGRGHWLHEEPGFENMAAGIVSWLEQHIPQPDTANAPPALGRRGVSKEAVRQRQGFDGAF